MAEPITNLMTHGEISRAIGLRIRAHRQFSKLSRQELAAKSGVSVPTIARLELKGVSTLSVIIKLAQALNALDTFNQLFEVSSYSSMDEFLSSTERMK